jgi:hypothetical protein
VSLFPLSLNFSKKVKFSKSGKNETLKCHLIRQSRNNNNMFINKRYFLFFLLLLCATSNNAQDYLLYSSILIPAELKENANDIIRLENITLDIGKCP